ncbi:MAG: MBL fold metallo-hydrolase [Candidatus Micrarchaeaceae archaeon]
MAYEFLHWIGHASFFMEIAGRSVYVDPFNIRKEMKKADIIFITHPHFDHFDIGSIKKIAKNETYFVAPSEVVEKLPYENRKMVAPNEKWNLLGIEFRTVPAYNIVRERLQNHPKAKGWVGYIINAGGPSIYHAGDTDFIEEMKGISVDLALLPIGGTYTMDVNEAAAAANAINAKNVVPMHYKALLGESGSKVAEEAFKRKVKNAIILKEIQEPSYSF